jgi:hypothetical protein
MPLGITFPIAVDEMRDTSCVQKIVEGEMISLYATSMVIRREVPLWIVCLNVFRIVHLSSSNFGLHEHRWRLVQLSCSLKTPIRDTISIEANP